MTLLPNKHSWVNLLATWGGVGGLPRAPGTWGSLAALPLWAVLQPLDQSRYIVVTLVLCLVGTWAADDYARRVGVSDPRQVVVDEVVGVLIALWGVPLHWGAVVVSFLLFRLFDIVKPWPVGWLDCRLPGGVGIMADDVAAGAMAWLFFNLFAVVLERMGGLLP